MITNDEKLRFLDRIKNLPSPSPVLQKIQKVLSNPASSADAAENALKLDPAIAGRILKLANSAYIGIPRTVSSLKNAVVLLGFKRIQSLVVASSLLSTCKTPKLPESFDLKRFWRHSIIVAMIGESIGKAISSRTGIESDDLFTAGIMHDIGKLMLGGYDPDRLLRAWVHGVETGQPYFLCEDTELPHTEAGALLAEQWNFPRDLIAAIKGHHAPSADSEHPLAASVIHVSDVVAHILGHSSFENETAPVFQQDALDLIALMPERIKVIAQSVIDDQKKLESLISFST